MEASVIGDACLFLGAVGILHTPEKWSREIDSAEQGYVVLSQAIKKLAFAASWKLKNPSLVFESATNPQQGSKTQFGFLRNGRDIALCESATGL